MSSFNDPAGFDLDSGQFDTGSTDHELPVIDSSPDLIPVIETAADDPLGMLHGAPASAADEWFFQRDQGYCLPASITQILSEVTGHSFSDESVVMSAVEELRIPFDSRGMTMPQGLQLLEHFGIDAEIETGLTLTDLETCLDEGRSIILGVDSSDIWNEPADPAELVDKADHALVITAIDTERGFVVLSDPGHPEGNQRIVPLTDFVEAWSDSGNMAVVTTEPTLSPEEIDAGGGTVTTERGPVLVPVTVNGDHPAMGADAQSHTVQAGDTLWDIAERVYGDGSQYQKIADASGIANPDLIYPGQVLTIPK